MKKVEIVEGNFSRWPTQRDSQPFYSFIHLHVSNYKLQVTWNLFTEYNMWISKRAKKTRPELPFVAAKFIKIQFKCPFLV